MINPFAETNWNPDTAARRAFGRSLVIGFPILSLLLLLLKRWQSGAWPMWPYWVAAIGVAVGLLCWALPAIAKPIYLVWYGFGCSMGIVVANLGVCVNPEFLREGSAIKDFENPPYTVIGESDTRAGDALLRVYAHLSAPVHRVAPDEASMVKYASNNFHALKVAFANEIGAICQKLEIDGQQVMRVFCEDRELNISPRYLRPGFGFGGSCLPKDLRAIVYVAKDRDLTTPLLNSVLASNDAHIQRVVDVVLEKRRASVLMIGLSFKVGSDDLRESPFVRLAEDLIGKGVPLRIYDPDVALRDVFGRNRAYVDEHLPHVGQLVVQQLDEVLAAADVVIIGKKLPDVAGLPSRLQGQFVIDLVGMPELKGALRPWG